MGDRLDQARRRTARTVGPLPRGQEPRERGGLDGLDLATQRRERAPPQPSQHVGVAPLALEAAGRNPPWRERALGLEVGERRLDPVERDAEARGDLVGDENGPWVRA